MAKAGLLVLVWILNGTTSGASENIPVTFTDAQVSQGQAVREDYDSFSAGKDKDAAIPMTQFTVQDKGAKKTYTISLPAGISQEMLAEYIRDKKKFYVDDKFIESQLYSDFDTIKNEVGKLKSLSDDDRKKIMAADRLFDLNDDLLKKFTSAYADSLSEIPLRGQPIGYLLNFVFKRASNKEPLKCDCVKLNGTDIRTCDPQK